MKNRGNEVPFRKSLRFKLLAPILLGALFISVFIFIISYQQHQNELKATLEEEFHMFEELFHSQLASKQKDAQMALESLITNDTIIKMFRKEDREGLTELLLPVYKDLYKTKYNITQFQFHQPPAKSFLRLHKPKKFGDDLSSFRKTVVEANKKEQIINGIEVGRGGPGLRIVIPLKEKGTHLGSVEFGMSIDDILNSVREIMNVDYAIAIKKSVFEKAKRFENKASDVVVGDYIFYKYSNSELLNLISKHEINDRINLIDFNDKPYVTHSLALKDYTGKTIGYIAQFRDISEEVASHNASLATTITTIFLVSLCFSFVMYFVLRKKIILPMIEMGKAAESFANGDYSVCFSCNAQDELGLLGSSLEIMASKIKTQLQYLDKLPTPVAIMDREFNIQYINDCACEFTGIPKREALTSKCFDVFQTPHCKTSNCACGIAMENNDTRSAETVSFSNNQERPIKYTGAPIKDEDGNVIGVLESCVEITDVKEHEKYLSRSTKKLLEAMDKFASGDLTVKVSAEKSDDEIGLIFKGFNESVSQLNNLINQVTEAVSATSSASLQISSTAEELATGSKEQSTQTTEVAGAVEEMAMTVAETTQNIELAAETAKDAGDTARKGGEVITNTINGIKSISEVVAKATKAVEHLGSNSDKIGAIVEVINEIAEQTNLLALNAAIEAARAGEHGRGFAVVADEVRKLAERTVNATKEISETISNIQNETGNAVNSIRLGKAEAEKGIAFASEANESLELIINKTQITLEQINQVASASQQLAVTAEQVSRNIDMINSVSHESAIGVDQIAKATDDLNQLTTQLENLTSMFKINKMVPNKYKTSKSSSINIQTP